MVRSAFDNYAKKQTIYQHTIPRFPRESSTFVPTIAASAESITSKPSPLFFIFLTQEAFGDFDFGKERESEIV
jgi:hypothetical protein